MQFPQVCDFTAGFSSSAIRSVLILLLFAGNLSTAPTATTSEKSVADDAAIPFDFPEAKARPFANATAEEKITLERLGGNDSEAIDMQHSSASIANATVDLLEDGDTSSEGVAASEIQSTNSSASESTTTSITTSVVANTPASVGPSSTASVTVESTSTASSTLLTSSTSTATTITEAKTTVQMPTTASPSDDQPEDATATALVKDNRGMPTGVVALVTMITFAIIAVVGYVGLIVWRRYLEYRYGNRELLVNDLEFDTNDLRHFEL